MSESGARPSEEPVIPPTIVVDAIETDEETPPPAPAVAAPTTAAPTTAGPDLERPGPLALLAAGFVDVFARPRVLLLLVVLSAFAALPPALVVADSADLHLAPLADAPSGPELLRGPIPGRLFQAWEQADPDVRRRAGLTLAPLWLAASWLGLLVCAGWMATARARALRQRGGHGLADFLAGGGRFFFPFLRTWLLGLPLFALATWLVWGRPGAWLMRLLLPPEGDPAFAAGETAARWVENGREIVALLLVFGVEILLDLARAGLVAGGRRSALLALFRGLGVFLFEPLRVLVLVGAGLTFELLLLAVLSALTDAELLPLWSLVLLLPFCRQLCRGARWAGLLRLCLIGRPAAASR
ncbi:MAG: hypothetical protein D6702_03430 [Planctomycetota bacterium]|nr:MAG: hypothetical protein D6702_03430 [Planctomycetota bacterium]